MIRSDAEIWLGFLLSLNGMAGSFLLGDPLGATASGNLGGTPLVNGANQTGASLSIDGCSNNITNWLKAGDYIQLGVDQVRHFIKYLLMLILTVVDKQL